MLLIDLVGTPVSAGKERPPWSQWQQIELNARGGPFLSGHVTINRTGTDPTSEIRMHTVARFLGARVADSTSVTTLDAKTGLPLKFVRRSRKRASIYRFDKDGYTIQKFKPPRGANRPLSEWRSYGKKRFEYPRDEQGHPLPTHNFSSMLLGLDRHALRKIGDEVRILVATSDGPRQFTITVVERRTEKRSFILARDDGRREKKRDYPITALRLRVLPEDENAEGLLSMRGETEIWVEADSATLLHIAGDAPKVGRRIKLSLSRMD